jgi:hypothetical protein
MLRTESERTLAAVRHRLGRNAFRFLCETHLELPPQPPPGCRTLVLFAHFDLQGIVDPYAAYYLKALHDLGATIVFVSGSHPLSLCRHLYPPHAFSGLRLVAPRMVHPQAARLVARSVRPLRHRQRQRVRSALSHRRDVELVPRC